MRLAQRGALGRDASEGSIIHFYHFREWRTSGKAFEFRNCSYRCSNRSMITTAVGRTKEFKDR